MTMIKIYNSYPTISYSKKAKLIRFLIQHQENLSLKEEVITHLVNYAFKETSSFGGFIVTEEENEEILGAMVVNNTGMKGYMPNNLIVASAFLPTSGKQGSMKRLLQKIMYLTRGDTALSLIHI